VAGPAVVLFVEFAGSRGVLRYGVSFAKRRSQQHGHGTAKASPSTTCSKAAAEGSISAISPIPDMRAAVGVDELGIDPHLVAAGLHRAFQHIAHPQILADGFGVDRFALVGEGRVARDHEDASDAREIGGQLIG